MRIVMLSWEYPPRVVGGISAHVKDLSEHLVQKGLEVHVLTRSATNAPKDEVCAEGVHIHRVDVPGEPKDFLHEIHLLNVTMEKRCRELLEEWRERGEPTMLHAHDWLTFECAKAIKYDYQLPLIATIHATEAGRFGSISNAVQRFIHDQEYQLTYEAWRVIVCSQFMREELRRLFEVPFDKIDVIYNGVKFEPDQPETSEDERVAVRGLFAGENQRLVLYVGRFVYEKGIHTLLDAIPTVLSQVPETRFVVVGGGDSDRYAQFLNWFGFGDRVIFPGFLRSADLKKLYRACDVAVFPSIYEPFGIVALEAMAAGAPVVSSDAGGLPEVVRHNLTGTTHYAGNAESLAWAIRRVLTDESRAKRLTSNAQRRLILDFSWDRLADLTIATYEAIWEEFLTSHHAGDSIWPVSDGAFERAKLSGVSEKATKPIEIRRPTSTAKYDGTPILQRLHEEFEEQAKDLPIAKAEK
ncbi:MAG: glycosyltransferase family 4 protein [Fimbriimonadaceae bacterium]